VDRSWHKGNHTPSFMSPVVDEERMKPFGDFFLVGVSAFSFVHCFDIIGSVTGKTFSP